MKNIVIVSTFLLCTTLNGQTVAGPHPSKVVDGYQHRDQGLEQRWKDEDAWLMLRPSFNYDPEMEEVAPLGGLEAQEDLVRLLAKTSSLGGGSLESWAELVSPAAVSLSYKIYDASNGELFLAGSEPVQVGPLVNFFEGAERSLLKSFDVEIAQGVSIADPYVCSAFDGMSLAIRLLPNPGQGWQMEMALCHTTSLGASPIETGSADMSGLDHLQRAIVEFSNTMAVTPGVPVSMHIPGFGDSELNIELTVDGAVPAIGMTAPNSEGASVVDASSMTTGDYKKFINGINFARLGVSEFGWLVFRGNSAGEAMVSAVEEIVAANTSRECELTISIGSETDEDVLYQVNGYLSAQHPLKLADGVSSQALTDWDVEIACSSRIADPLMSDCFSGLLASIELLDSGQVKLDLDMSECSLGESKTIFMGSELIVLGQVVLPAQKVNIEQVNEFQAGIHGVYLLDSNQQLTIKRNVMTLFGERHNLTVHLEIN